MFKIHIFSIMSLGPGISGGERIMMEMARQMSNLGHAVSIYVWENGKILLNKQHIKDDKLIKINLNKIGIFVKTPFFIKYIYLIFLGIKLGLTVKIYDVKNSVLYPSSEFWPDAFACLLLKWRYKELKLVSPWFQTAPNPFKGFSEVSGATKHKSNSFPYWFMQLLIKPFIYRFADLIVVNNDTERKEFPNKNVHVMYGGVKTNEIKAYLATEKIKAKKYDAVFQGRLHPQKGVLDLIEMWADVVKSKPDAKLALIGDGPLRQDVENMIRKHHIKNNVDLFGYVFDGKQKYDIFSSSRLVLHPAVYDSGGMAAGEAMAFGIPCIGFNLKAYESYYPKGMVKVKIGDKKAFVEKILELLNDEKMRSEIGKEASEMIFREWSWKSRIKALESKILELYA